MAVLCCVLFAVLQSQGWGWGVTSISARLSADWSSNRLFLVETEIMITLGTVSEMKTLYIILIYLTSVTINVTIKNNQSPWHFISIIFFLGLHNMLCASLCMCHNCKVSERGNLACLLAGCTWLNHQSCIGFVNNRKKQNCGAGLIPRRPAGTTCLASQTHSWYLFCKNKIWLHPKKLLVEIGYWKDPWRLAVWKELLHS